ncbi:MAG: pyridoxamine 5'-phosphate oxidase family protein [Synechococcus sp.]
MTAASSPLPPWRPLLRAAQHKEGRSPMGRWLQLATVASDGSPRIRTLVFRGWRDGCTLELFTDARSAKIQDLAHEARNELCWLLPKARCQFRLRGIARSLAPQTQDARERHHWQQLRPEGRALWGWPTPGQPLEPTAHFPAALPDGTPKPDSFVVLTIQIQQVELLELTNTPHRRQRWNADNGWQAIALNP